MEGDGDGIEGRCKRRNLRYRLGALDLGVLTLVEVRTSVDGAEGAADGWKG